MKRFSHLDLQSSSTDATPLANGISSLLATSKEHGFQAALAILAQVTVYGNYHLYTVFFFFLVLAVVFKLQHDWFAGSF